PLPWEPDPRYRKAVAYLSLQSAAGAAGAAGSDHLGGQALPLRSDRRGHVRPAGASDLAPFPARGAYRLRDPPVALAQTGCGYLAEHATTAARGFGHQWHDCGHERCGQPDHLRRLG